MNLQMPKHGRQCLFVFSDQLRTEIDINMSTIFTKYLVEEFS